MEIVAIEKGQDSVPFSILMILFLATQFEEKPKSIPQFVECYTHFVYIIYLRLLDYYINEILHLNLDDFESQQKAESLKAIDDFKSRPIDFTRGILLEVGANSIETFSNLELNLSKLTSRFDYYIDKKTPQELKADMFIYNLELAKKSKQVKDFNSDIIELANLDIEKKVRGLNSIVAYKTAIDGMSKVLIKAYSKYYQQISKK